MKAFTILLTITILAVGCRTPRKVIVIAPRADNHHLSHMEESAIRAALPTQETTIPNPPVLMSVDYASICPYCDTVNLSHLVSVQGGTVVTKGQPIDVTIGGITTNVIATASGNLESWCITYVCRNCAMPYSDSRQQFVPKTTSVRLPIR